MNRAEHHAAAEKLMAAAGDISIGDTVTGYTRQLVLMAAAQVHATLASTELIPMPRPMPLCDCEFLPDPHVWGASCPPCKCARVKGLHQPGKGACGSYSADRVWPLAEGAGQS